VYDVAWGRPSKIDVEWNPLQRLDTPFRARRATRLGAVAGWVICGDHVFTALIVAHRVPKFYVLAGNDPAVLSVVQGVMALIAAGLALLMMRRPKLWVAAILLVWALGTLAWPLTIHLYAQAAPPTIAALILIFAVLGFRGALALQKLPSVP
jgi:hypothetical protein